MKNWFFFIMICVLLLPVTSAKDFSGFGVGKGDFIQYRITGFSEAHTINGTLVESSDQRSVFGVNLTIGDIYSITVTNMVTTSYTILGDPIYAVYGDFTFGDLFIENISLFEVHDTDWEEFRAETERFHQQLEAVSYQYNVHVNLTENTASIGRMIGYYENRTLSNGILVTNYFSEIAYDKATGTVLASHYTTGSALINQERIIETWIHTSGLERVAFEKSKKEFKVPYPMLELMVSSLFTLMILKRKYNK